MRKCAGVCSSVNILMKLNNSLCFRALYCIILRVMFSKKIHEVCVLLSKILRCIHFLKMILLKAELLLEDYN